MPHPSRPARTLRAMLDAAGRTPPDVAARIAIDVAGVLAGAPGGAIGEGPRPGALDARRIEVAGGGRIVLPGLGLRGRDPVADLRALGAVLHECLSGEPPGEPAVPLDVPGVPAPLAAVVDRATGAAGPPHPTVAALADAIAAAIAAPATGAEVAAYADAVLPSEEGPPALDAGGTFPAPAPARPPPRLVAVAAVALAVGFAAGFAAERAYQPGPPRAASATAAGGGAAP